MMLCIQGTKKKKKNLQIASFYSCRWKQAKMDTEGMTHGNLGFVYYTQPLNLKSQK